MPVVPSTLEYGLSNVTKVSRSLSNHEKQENTMIIIVLICSIACTYILKETSRSRSSQRVVTSKSLRFSSSNQQTSVITRAKKPVNKMVNNNNLLLPPRPPDPTLFIRAGTSGVRHLFPIHLPDTSGLFSRSISRLRSRTPTTKSYTNIEMIRYICSSIQTLQHFDISENLLDDLPLDISLLIHLEILNCSHNQLTNLSDSFDKLNQLKELDLSFNHFKHLPNVISTFKHLLRLNCEHNFIKTIDLDLLNLKHLKTLIFDHNQLQALDTIDFSQMKRLEYIHIAHNQLIKFPCNLHKLTHLKDVNLSYNCLTSFPIELLLVNTLDVLNLSHNLLTKLPLLSDAYKRKSLIFSIDLSFNQLTKFYDYLLFISVKLDLSDNKIQSIPNDVIRKLNYDIIKNRELKITNNPLIQPTIPSDIFNEESINAVNILPIIRNYFGEQQIDETVRQGFKICITGYQKSGKSSLAYCLEEFTLCLPSETEERIVTGK
jgi:Leucine-rich repeat (LRR) protein